MDMATAISRRAGESSARDLNQAYHHALLAHGRGVEAVRKFGKPGSVVGLVHNHLPAPPIPFTETEADIGAARAEYERTNGQLMGPVFLGRYPESFLHHARADAPQVEPGDMEQIARPTDFLGLNIYAGNFVRAGAHGQPEVLPFPSRLSRRGPALAQDHPAEHVLGRAVRGRCVRRQVLLHDRKRRDV